MKTSRKETVAAIREIYPAIDDALEEALDYAPRHALDALLAACREEVDEVGEYRRGLVSREAIVAAESDVRTLGCPVSGASRVLGDGTLITVR